MQQSSHLPIPTEMDMRSEFVRRESTSEGSEIPSSSKSDLN